jgi:hypothetical protein
MAVLSPLPCHLWRHWSVFNLSSASQRFDVDAAFGQGVDIESQPWYPRVAVNSVTDAIMTPPTGFTAHLLHVRWDSLPMLLPEGDLSSSEWWGALSYTWGKWIEGKPISVSPSSKGWIVEFENHEAHVLPLDEDGHGRRLSSLNCNELHTAIGGLQFEGRDVILVFDKLESNPLSMDDENLRLAGQTLGRFHAICGRHLATPNDERNWNHRLDQLEPRTRSATKWRAPHSADTQGTITHRNFGLEHCHLINEKIIIKGCIGGVYNALIPETSPSPAIRDVASAVIDLTADQKRVFCEGWVSTAPAHWYSHKALDGHRGGLLIWEYEQHLEQRLFHQAWGHEEPPHVTHFLSEVSTVQNSMYRVRTIAAGALVCTFVPLAVILYWIFYPDSPIPSGSAIAGIGTMGICGWVLNKLYRHLAPRPW